jgi:hypothetical protein
VEYLFRKDFVAGEGKYYLRAGFRWVRICGQRQNREPQEMAAAEAGVILGRLRYD